MDEPSVFKGSLWMSLSFCFIVFSFCFLSKSLQSYNNTNSIKSRNKLTIKSNFHKIKREKKTYYLLKKIIQQYSFFHSSFFELWSFKNSMSVCMTIHMKNKFSFCRCFPEIIDILLPINHVSTVMMSHVLVSIQTFKTYF